jgi:hypothetical protein
MREGGSSAAASGSVVVAGQWLGRTAGSARAERRQLLPGDELVDNPTVVTNHAVTIPAPPEQVWPWLVQTGRHSTTHLPASWRARLGASIDWTWTFTLTPTRDGGTRLLLRVRGQTRPWWPTAAYVAALVPADFVMAHSMLAGISLRVQAVG